MRFAIPVATLAAAAALAACSSSTIGSGHTGAASTGPTSATQGPTAATPGGSSSSGGLQVSGGPVSPSVGVATVVPASPSTPPTRSLPAPPTVTSGPKLPPLGTLPKGFPLKGAGLKNVKQQSFGQDFQVSGTAPDPMKTFQFFKSHLGPAGFKVVKAADFGSGKLYSGEVGFKAKQYPGTNTVYFTGSQVKIIFES